MSASGAREPGAVIAEITALGPFFALAADGGRGPGWQPLSAPLLAERVGAVRRWLAAAGGRPADAVEPRVAASVAHLGLAARLVSPALAAAVLHGRPLLFTLEEVRWRPVLGGPVPLSLPPRALGGPCRTPEALADRLAAGLLAGPLEELGAAFGVFGVSRHILRGNTASAVGGAAAALTRSRPEQAAATGRFTALLLGRPPLAGEGTTADGIFRRRSCCLIYRAAPGGRGALCGDCALDRRPAAGRVPDSPS
ncbi:(2Fe-2S)-binding protein [Actinacidiphila sp. ITFR-21]|uniref:(2Fe-2S)-binding protein n=1 Tax=Actinacidiphila sp. ITFR-21 TaxID=3075199 RepID=UPI00288A320C|nr:(2Fe-2S)-binding protein [Streptomyces sp. ITFR-21]WNI14156.1 (2Fe-2S)-binding protein [Streptomyces sp. ITFR-21]